MMDRRFLGVGLLVGVFVSADVAAGQTRTVSPTFPQGGSQASSRPKAENWVPKRTPDGQPDLQGTWVNFDSTPFEAPANTPPAAAAPNPGINPPAHWAEHDSPESTRRRSMVVEPADGRVPVQPWAEAQRDFDLAHLGDSYVHETPWVRCITRGIPAGMFPAGYNNAYQIIQIPGYVVINYEMIHETRIIPIDGRPHLGSKIRQWNGDPRGHFEGNTLVVETTNYNNKGSIATSAATGRMRGIPQSDALHIVERFTSVNADTISYEVTVDDPKVYTKPWKVALPLNRDSNYQFFEYACHEGNVAMAAELSGGRAQEKAAAAAAHEQR
jgi:hypothetical protein